MCTLVEDDIFELQCILNNISIKFCTRVESGIKQILALITGDNEVVLHYTYGELPSVIKRLPWFTDSSKVIEAVCFDPSATWLLVVVADGSLYIVPALSLVDKKQKVDCKWSVTDLTYFQRHNLTPDSKPTSVVWWQTLDCNQNALVGYENGSIALISLTDGRCLGNCTINEHVQQLLLCQDNNLGPISLLINGKSGQQWRLLLEAHSVGYLWPPDCNNQTDDSTKSRLYNLKQIGADKLASIRQKLTEGRRPRRDSQNSDTASESSNSESASIGPVLLPHLCDTLFAPQFARNRYLFSAFYKPTSLLTVHAVDVESAPLYVHRLIPSTKSLFLTDLLIYTVNNECNLVSIISSRLSECRLEGDGDFNTESLLAQFCLNGETILDIYKLTDLSSVRLRKSKDDNKNKVYKFPRPIDESNIKKPRIDTCIIVTDNSVFKVAVRSSPVNKVIEFVTNENNLEQAEKLSYIYSLNLQSLLEYCGDIMIAKGSYHSGVILYKQAKVHLLKRVLKLAVSADCRTLLKFVHLCLSASRVDMSMATKIHIGNLAVMAYTELILRHGGPSRATNTKDFMNFLRYEEFYDQVLAVNVACQAGHWNIVTLLAKSRGLQPEVVSALGQILQSARAPRYNDYDFLYALSEPSLTQSLLIAPLSCQIILHYIRTNLDTFPDDILQRLAVQLDPSQPCAIPLTTRLFNGNLYSSSLDTTGETVDLDNPDRALIVVKDFIETFLLVLTKLVSKRNNLEFDLSLLNEIEPANNTPHEEIKLQKLPDLEPLSCGYKHAAVVRNGNIYSMGVSSSGCLGLGPLLTQSSPPKLVYTLNDLKVKVLSVSCGRKHTLALTDFGVYGWGSNSYGQLGLGPFIQESPYPQILTTLSFTKIVQVSTGQYHSLALTSSGQVYSWGWGIHGQLGHGSCDNQYYPKLISFEYKIKQVAAGHAHSLILTHDGKIFGCGSNLFGQLETCNLDGNKSSKPLWMLIMPDIYIPVEKISASYFHNIALRADDEVYVWGASPQEVRISQSKSNQKQNGVAFTKPGDSWRASVLIYTGTRDRPVEKVAVGYRHCAILQSGKILWSKNKECEMSTPKLREQDNISIFGQKFSHVACGLDYTMAIDQSGKLLAWGSAHMAQTILGRPLDEQARNMGGKVAFSKNTRRVIKFPGTLQEDSDLPVEVPGLPTMAISFTPNNHQTLFSKKFTPYAIRKIENIDSISTKKQCNKPLTKSCSPINFTQTCPGFKYGQKTLHYALQLYFGLYDTENVILKCLEVQNYQAASKIAMLDGHFSDSLGFQLTAFKKFIDSFNLDLNYIFSNKEYNLKEKDEDCVELILKPRSDEYNEYSGDKLFSNSSPAHILSQSSSLDSIRQWGDDVEHQGGCESPCEMSDLGDIRQNITQYVQSLKINETSPPISSVSKEISETDLGKNKTNKNLQIDIKDKQTKEIIEKASQLVEIYIRKIYVSENHILMQNILMKCIEFWLTNNLPVPVLENILLKNLDKYFYPLSILLFCKNFNNVEDIIKKDDCEIGTNSAGFLKEFSTKFCLQLCSMVLENVNKS